MKRLVTSVSLASLVLGCAAALAASVPERFDGNIVDTPGVSRKSTAFFILQVDRWGTEDEAASYLGILKEKGQKGLLEAFWDAEESGYVRVGDRLGYPIVFARQFSTPEGRTVRAFTDRPIQFFEAINQTRSRDYPIAIIEIKFPAEGKGEGVLVATASVTFDDQGQLVVEQRGTTPFRLLNMKAKPVKEKKGK